MRWRARNLLLKHDWPGNIRELLNTLRRAVVWSTGNTISIEEMREAILPAKGLSGDTILNRPLGKELDLQGILSAVARHYLQRALDEAQGNKTEAAKLIGLPSYQTFTNWLKKYGVPS